ncbi:hypothetical protein CK203_110567 [Vitis vinifera]|uniref:Retrotransposon gag domain-containing protein n=1 Tax=Vitis vinifera TaxID=29760 RepID=A0A438CQ29_VITVI|nr:hypothetical protein CK203_110567 [Vitis vinifera]
MHSSRFPNPLPQAIILLALEARLMGHHPVFASSLPHAAPYCLLVEVIVKKSSQHRGDTVSDPISSKPRKKGEALLPVDLASTLTPSMGRTKQRCPHPQGVGHQPWAMKVTLTGVRLWKDTSEKGATSPSHDRQLRSQRTNSRQNQEATYPRNTKPLSDVHGVWPDERPLPAYHAPPDESSDSTCISSKRRRDRKSQLLDAMHVRISIWVENPSGCLHFHPDVSHPKSGYPHLDPMPHPPLDDIRNSGSGWERRHFNFIRQTYPDGKGGVSTSSISHVRILHGIYPDHSKLKVINFVDYSLSQGAPAGHKSADTLTGHESTWYGEAACNYSLGGVSWPLSCTHHVGLSSTPTTTTNQRGCGKLSHSDSISRRLDDMFSTSFNSHIINYEPLRGFIMPKFSVYDGFSDPFDHIMHYRQLMTLDIGNDVLLCKVFPVSLQGQALLWFHCLPMNFVDNLWDLSEAFVG